MEKINGILIKTFKISEDDASKNLGMKNVAKWDSITHMNLIVAIEDEYKIELTGDDIADMITFDAIRHIIQKYIA
jgi:acyl carrier protein